MNGHDLNQNLPVLIAAICLVSGLGAGFLVGVLLMWRRHDQIKAEGYAEGKAAAEKYAADRDQVRRRVDNLPRHRPDVTAVIHGGLFRRPKSHARRPQ